jgi:hypothetical protein
MSNIVPPEKKAWSNMIHRCCKPDHAQYPHYGGRGIKIYDLWMDYDIFIIDMGMKPTPEHVLGRYDTDGDYTPVNTYWATTAETATNRKHKTCGDRVSKGDVLAIVALKNTGLSQTEIAEMYGIKPATVSGIQTGKHYSNISGIISGTRLGTRVDKKNIDKNWLSKFVESQL